MTELVDWPAIIVFRGDDELIYVENLQAWLSDPDISSNVYDASDRLIDSSGMVFSFNELAENVVLTRQKELLSLAQIDELIRRHLSTVGQVCVSKFASTSITDAFKTIRQST